MATRKIIIPLPTGDTPEAKAERSHLLASRWATSDKSVPRGELFAGRVYNISDADVFVRKGIAKYVDASGNPTDEQAPPAPKAIRAGTQEWKDLPSEERVGSDEYREFQFQKALDEAAAKELETVATAAEAKTKPKKPVNGVKVAEAADVPPADSIT